MSIVLQYNDYDSDALYFDAWLFISERQYLLSPPDG